MAQIRAQKIEYHNLRDEAAAGRLPEMVGRREESERLRRIFERRLRNNVLLVGPHGIGKTALVYGWVKALSTSRRHDKIAFLQLSAEHLAALDSEPSTEERLAEAFGTIPASLLFVDDFGREVFRSDALVPRIHRLYKQLLRRAPVRIVFTLEPHEYEWLEREYPAFIQEFETLHLKSQSSFEYRRILTKKMPRLNAEHRILVPDAVLKKIVTYAERFPSLGVLPRSAIGLLDEALAASASRGHTMLKEETIAEIVEGKTGVPKSQLSKDDLEVVRNLEANLNERVVGQERAIAQIARTLQRAKLGLRNPNRPLGSFLLLGPSGVGKTETAKNVAEIMFGRSESFIRFDMSEFQQDHTVQRLIGAPAGYIGYEEGGALTNALRKNPYSLILLDEIEKAHPKVFDIFLQVLDDGRLSSGQNETVDARNTIVMATSNAAVAEILRARSGAKVDDEAFIRSNILPALAKTFRLEFINRFDSILIFEPLSHHELLKVAKLETRKIAARLSEHNVRFELDPHIMGEKVRKLADPRFGARPVKRFIEETCEALLTEHLLNTQSRV